MIVKVIDYITGTAVLRDYDESQIAQLRSCHGMTVVPVYSCRLPKEKIYPNIFEHGYQFTLDFKLHG